MKLQTLFLFSVAAIAAVLAVPSGAADPAIDAGLVAVQSRDLDQLYLRPNADVAGYRKILVDPARVAFRNDFNKNKQDSLGVTHRFTADDVQRISDETAAGLQSSVADAFKSRGYEIAAAAGPGVMRLSPSVTELYINADQTLAPGTTRAYTKEAGEATLVLEARDAVSGTLLGRVVDHRITPENSKGSQLTDLRQTGSVTNNFWFDSTFRRWATACADAFESSNPAKVGLDTHR